MISAIRGRLITASFARDVLPTLPGVLAAPPSFHRALRVWSERCEAALGPASSVRAIGDIAAVPLLEILGHTITRRIDSADTCVLQTSCRDRVGASVVIIGWNEPLAHAWRSSVQNAITVDGRWCFCCNGRGLRIVDGVRTWAREYLEFDLVQLSADADARGLLWTLARAEAIGSDEPFLDHAVDLSARHTIELCRALGTGVLGGLRILFGAFSKSQHVQHSSQQVIFEHSLTVLYRVLFLLFAEARSLVPIWHPIYRDRYSLDAIVTTLLRGRRYRGLWSALNAITRLANDGCSAGDLKVTAFNGRLFAPSHAARFEGTRIDDDVIGRAIVSVSVASASRHRKPARIVYRDLDVEQLGAIYEHVLDYEPTCEQRATGLERTRDARQSTGTFYTPKAVTAHLVRRALEPLVRDRVADDILALRVLDPAMGSGAFLVAASRYLASAAEDALVREGRWHPGDVRPEDRAELRRDVASKCLFGVDLNPMAVQLARLSLWLATLAADKPLSFLDHHLVSGDSLIGATPDDLKRQPTRVTGRKRRQESLPLFESADLSSALKHATNTRLKLTYDADRSAEAVRAKEQALAALLARDTPLGRWSSVLDLWCSGWFWSGDGLDRATFNELVDHVVRGRSALPERTARPLLAHAEGIAERLRFLHWPLTFPEVFVDGRGEPLSNPGFDAVLGNPPWDMVRGDSGEGTARDDRRRNARHLVNFVREAGIYRVESRAHLNRYQLFLERALQLVRLGGRIGFVVPSGALTDPGTAELRRHLFDRAEVDSVVGLDNRSGIFQVHRSLRFVLLSCTAGRPTTAIACRFGVTQPDDLGAKPQPGSSPMILSRKFLARLSGEDDLGIPELSGEADRRIVEKISANLPWSSDERGWNARFGRELNASDDRDAFVPFTGDPYARPVVEGKQVEPFRVALETCRFEIARDNGTLVRIPRRARLAYRDVASATNRLTLIAAVVPPEAVTTHTLFCLKHPSPVAEQRVLCALLNSFVANYLIRLRVNTHVTVALVSRLPLPVVRVGHPSFTRFAKLSLALMSSRRPVEGMQEYAELQAMAAQLYGLTEAELEHVLSTFPLIASEIKAEVLSRFRQEH